MIIADEILILFILARPDSISRKSSVYFQEEAAGVICGVTAVTRVSASLSALSSLSEKECAKECAVEYWEETEFGATLLRMDSLAYVQGREKQRVSDDACDFR